MNFPTTPTGAAHVATTTFDHRAVIVGCAIVPHTIPSPHVLPTSTTFRSPIPPRPVEPFDLAHPFLPRALDGLTILHVSDLHVRRNLLHTDRYRAILEALNRTPADIIAITGDLMDEPGHERAALDTLHALAAAWRPRLGAFAIFGNHDTPDFRRAAARELTTINFIGGRTIDIPIGSVGPTVPPVRPALRATGAAPRETPDRLDASVIESSPPHGATLRLLGLDWPEDPLAVMLQQPQNIPTSTSPSLPTSHFLLPTFPLALAHHPNSLIPAAALNIPILLAGHTHAGQVRLHPRLAPHTSSDMPPHLASGILQLRATLCCISRGLGDGVVEGLRINCPRQMPLYTLRRAERMAPSEVVTQVVSW